MVTWNESQKVTHKGAVGKGMFMTQVNHVKEKHHASIKRSDCQWQQPQWWIKITSHPAQERNFEGYPHRFLPKNHEALCASGTMGIQWTWRLMGLGRLDFPSITIPLLGMAFWGSYRHTVIPNLRFRFLDVEGIRGVCFFLNNCIQPLSFYGVIHGWKWIQMPGTLKTKPEITLPETNYNDLLLKIGRAPRGNYICQPLICKGQFKKTKVCRWQRREELLATGLTLCLEGKPKMGAWCSDFRRTLPKTQKN